MEETTAGLLIHYSRYLGANYKAARENYSRFLLICIIIRIWVLIIRKV